MKILHVCETATGGVASYLNMLCDVDESFDNVIVVPKRHVKGIDPSLNIRTYDTTGRNVGAIWNMLRATRRAIKEEQPDIVFFQASFSLLAL
ncbi:MAG: glycosyl transferase, partial [Aurantimonas sp.]|nr:glycosyl transferase [Aurantimonas sp.]